MACWRSGTSPVHCTRFDARGLVLHGEYDQATSQVVQPLITHITHCRGVTIPDSSHNPHEENTEPCLTAVREFLRGLD